MDNLKSMSRSERIAYLKKNKDTVMAIKKATVKEADGIAVDMVTTDKAVQKSLDEDDTEDKESLQVTAIISTTNILDSHDDVHLPKIWNKSLNENRSIMHLQEHKMEFDKIIADGDDLKAYVMELTWKSLGFDWVGKTEALIFDSTVRKERNEYMFDQYNKGRVNSHSVGMRYIKVSLAIDDEDAGSNYDTWTKYIDQIVNKQTAIDQGYFYAVSEAKVFEGSAVPLGSNFATPTQSIKAESQFWTTLSKSVKPPEALDEVNQFYKHLNF